MRNFLKYIYLFCLMGTAYCLIEICFRGWTRGGMFFIGGFCGVILYSVTVKLPVSSPVKWLICGGMITCVELVSGVILNLWLKQDLWSYANQPFNLFGQVCPLFSLLWVLLSIPGTGFCSLIDKRIFRSEA